MNPYIPRRVEYEWHRSLESAEEVAEQAGQPLLVVFCRRLTRDWARLKKLLLAREVHRMFADMAHCRVGTLPPWSKARVTQFGAIKLPALIIADRDGTYHVLEMPTSREAVIRFAEEAVNGQPSAVRQRD